MDIDEGRKAFEEFHAAYSAIQNDICNEAETRKKVIDVVLEKILGWDPVADINYEVRVAEDGKTQFADYRLRTATTAILVEAKRNGKTFKLPTNRQVMKLGGVLSSGEVGNAIQQVRDYARKMSIPYSVVTNGNAWIVFPAVRTDSVTFEETQAKVFRSLDDIRDRFIEFWELLSRQRVIEGSIENELFGVFKEKASHRLIAEIREPGYRLGRNKVYEHIEPAVLAALTDEVILTDAEALEACYVKSSERIKYDSRLNMHLRDSKPPLHRKAIRVRKGKSSTELDETLRKSTPDIRQFILLLGSVGAGKTTFLHYTRKVSAADVIEGAILWLYLDFRRATPADEPRQFIYGELLRIIEADKEFKLGDWNVSIRPAYRDIIETFKRGSLKLLFEADEKEFKKEIARQIQDDRRGVEPYVKRVIRNAGRIRPAYLIIDNVDQIEDEERQSQIFAEAQAAARFMNLNVILSLRETTFLNHRESPVFDAFQVDSLYIDPPQVKPVLTRRFAYARKYLAGKQVEIISESGMTFKVEDLGVFFEIVATSLLDDEAGVLIEVLAGGDIRRGLSLVREFLASGHISADHVLYLYVTRGKGRRFPVHEVFKGAILGQRKYYRDEESLVANIFDSKLGSPGVQLLRLQIIACLVRSSKELSFEGSLVEDIKSEMYRVGVRSTDVDKVLVVLHKCRLIQTHDNMRLDDGSRLYPTRFGGYMVHVLCKQFQYLEPCVLDSFIFEDDAWRELLETTHNIEEVSKPERIPVRIKRVEIYLEYLKKIEESWLQRCKRYNLSENWRCQIIDSDFMGQVKRELTNVQESAERVYRRRS